MSGELERTAAACILPGFVGLEPPDWVLRRLEAGLGGVVLFARNVRDTEQVAELTRGLRAERGDVLVAIDEEGGDVTRLEAASGSSYPGNHALGIVDDVVLTEDVGAAIGCDLAAVGINLDFAPVADVNSNPHNPVIGVRSFGSDPELVARHVSAFVGGLQRAGVAACAKHFPGHGDTAADSHLELPTVADDLDDLRVGALVPFRAAIDAGVRSIMTAHISLPAVDAAAATVSPAILSTLLRDELGFAGLVVTDALEMRGISAGIGMEEGAVQALAAGADGLCLGFDMNDELVGRIHAAILDGVRTGRLSEQRLAEAAGRVSETAEWASQSAPGPATSREVGLVAARRALRVEGDAALSGPALVVELRPEASIAAGAAQHGLGTVLSKHTDVEVVLFDAASDVMEVRPDRRRLVLVTRDGHRYAWERAAAEALLADHPDAILVETGLPYWRPREAVNYVVTHGAGRVNLEAAAEALLAGHHAAGGPNVSVLQAPNLSHRANP